MKRLAWLLLVTLACSRAYSAPEPGARPPGYVPAQGFVPDSVTAVRVALAPIYNAQQLESEQTFIAQLRDSKWIVEGTLTPPRLGGVAHVEIAKRDGRILFVSHGR